MFIYINRKIAKESAKIYPTGTKGVGGYRPVINWREISIRKKRIADRQILFCVLSSGFGIVCVGFLFLILGLYVVETSCPFSWEVVSSRCMHLSSLNVSWYGARQLCGELGADMLEPRSTSDVADYTGKLKRSTWIGLSRNEGEDVFKWHRGSTVEFVNFEPSPVKQAPSTRECVYALDTGIWIVTSSCELDTLSLVCTSEKNYSPLVLVGPVVILCGAFVMILSIEVCHRNRQISRKSSVLSEKMAIQKKTSTKQLETGTGIDDSTFAAEVQSKKPIAETLQVAEATSDEDKNVYVAGLVSQVSDQTPSQDQLELILSPKNLS